jgi:hypothetical protein
MILACATITSWAVATWIVLCGIAAVVTATRLR